MAATEFEFRNRTWIIGALFVAAYVPYNFGLRNIVWDFLQRSTVREEFLARTIFGFAAVILALAAWIRTWAAAYLRHDVVHDPNLRTEALVADGPYRYVRNPLYLAGILVAAGFGTLYSRIGFMIFVVGMTALFVRLIGREEAELERERGESFREYCRRVPRLLPSLRPRIPAGGLEPKWGQAFRGEVPTWGLFVTMTGYTITLRDPVIWALMGVTAAIWLAQRIVWRMGKKDAA